MAEHEGKEFGLGDLVLLDSITDDGVVNNLKLRYVPCLNVPLQRFIEGTYIRVTKHFGSRRTVSLLAEKSS